MRTLPPTQWKATPQEVRLVELLSRLRSECVDARLVRTVTPNPKYL